MIGDGTRDTAADDLAGLAIVNSPAAKQHLRIRGSPANHRPRSTAPGGQKFEESATAWQSAKDEIGYNRITPAARRRVDGTRAKMPSTDESAVYERTLCSLGGVPV